MKRLTVILLCAVGIMSSTGTAQQSSRAFDNAALRYWMAFAQMSDSPISAADAAQMDAIVNGKAPWDEQKFGPLVEQNKDAIETMIRATELPYCEWGIEYHLGPEAPVAHLPKARALARLNRLYAERLASEGNFDGAVRATLAGIRFAQRMAQNASLFGALTAKAALIPQLAEAQALAAGGHLSPGQNAALRAAIQSLPEGGFNWENAAHLEGWAVRRAVTTLSHASDPKALYLTWFGNPAPETFHLPNGSEMMRLDRTMAFYAILLGLPSEKANAQLPALQMEITALDPVSQMLVPSPARMIAARADLIRAQRETIESLGIH
jgi:hypothetical protein